MSSATQTTSPASSTRQLPTSSSGGLTLTGGSQEQLIVAATTAVVSSLIAATATVAFEGGKRLAGATASAASTVAETAAKKAQEVNQQVSKLINIPSAVEGLTKKVERLEESFEHIQKLMGSSEEGRTSTLSEHRAKVASLEKAHQGLTDNLTQVNKAVEAFRDNEKVLKKHIFLLKIGVVATSSLAVIGGIFLFRSNRPSQKSP